MITAMKKQISYIIASAVILLGLGSCSRYLNLEDETSVTNSYLYANSDGIQRAVVGLYGLERYYFVLGGGDVVYPYLVQMLDYDTDIIFFRAGSGADIARLDNMSPTSGYVNFLWSACYQVIGKANEIIAASESLGFENEAVRRSWAEAKLFRARMYFTLYQRYERLYLNTEPTTVSNLDRKYSASGKEEIFALIKSDLDDAIQYLDWALPVYGGGTMYGRMTKAVAKHVRAQVAMWEGDWDRAISECESIFNEGAQYNYLESSPDKVFHLDEISASGGENLRSPEILYSYQFSTNAGGGGTISGSTLAGQVISSFVTPRYAKISGCVLSSDYGGFGWGRVSPNSYLLSLYDHDRDIRYKNMFKVKYSYNDLEKYPDRFGKEISVNNMFGVTKTQYAEQFHPSCLKHQDFWTNQDDPERKTSFRDLVVYRLAETALICCEAYYHKAMGNSIDYPSVSIFNTGSTSDPSVLKYYNMTYVRAGNDPKTSVDMEDILQECARELNFEGVRWPQLKRLGILAERARLHSGDTVYEDPNLDINYNDCRLNFVKGKHEIWPIPQNQIQLMGGEEAFPQNDAWK
jgi:hypothetical protein